MVLQTFFERFTSLEVRKRKSEGQRPSNKTPLLADAPTVPFYVGWKSAKMAQIGDKGYGAMRLRANWL
jgi:hypothetical protein